MTSRYDLEPGDAAEVDEIAKAIGEAIAARCRGEINPRLILSALGIVAADIYQQSPAEQQPELLKWLKNAPLQPRVTTHRTN
jgi:hypothetical protein